MGTRLTSQTLPFYTVLIFEPWNCITWSKNNNFKNTTHKTVAFSPCYPHPWDMRKGRGLVGLHEQCLSGHPLLYWPRHIEDGIRKGQGCCSCPQRPPQASWWEQRPWGFLGCLSLAQCLAHSRLLVSVRLINCSAAGRIISPFGCR